MSFYLAKARIMTSHQQLANYFSNSVKFNKTILQFVPEAMIDVIAQTKAFQVRHLEAAYTTYELVIDQKPSVLQIIWMQSTSKTSYCFDVIFQITPHGAAEKIPELDYLLESIRKKHNKNWIIEDHHLDDASLK